MLYFSKWHDNMPHHLSCQTVFINAVITPSQTIYSDRLTNVTRDKIVLPASDYFGTVCIMEDC